jgi:hypothetical protein
LLNKELRKKRLVDPVFQTIDTPSSKDYLIVFLKEKGLSRYLVEFIGVDANQAVESYGLFNATKRNGVLEVFYKPKCDVKGLMLGYIDTKNSEVREMRYPAEWIPYQ